MSNPIPKTDKSDELLKALLKLPTDLSAIENLLKSNSYTADEISRAGYDYAEDCWSDCLDYFDTHDEEWSRFHTSVIPDILSSKMFQIFELLLNYGLNPNAVCDGETVMCAVSSVYNEYVAADTLKLLIEHGGNPYLTVDGQSLFDIMDMYIVLDIFEQSTRRIYDSIVHCYLVLLGYGDYSNEEYPIDIFAERRSECDLPSFRIEDFKNHRNYYYGISNVSCHGDSWSLHIFDKRTNWEVARL